MLLSASSLDVGIVILCSCIVLVFIAYWAGFILRHKYNLRIKLPFFGKRTTEVVEEQIEPFSTTTTTTTSVVTYDSSPAIQIPPIDFSEVLSQIGRVNAILTDRYDQIDRMVSVLPMKLLETLKGSVAHAKGDLGEFIQLLRLKADYDIVLPLGDIVDYLCIKLPKQDRDTNEDIAGTIDFVEVKTNSSRLSPAQKKFRDLVVSKQINFKQVTVKLNDIKEM